MFISPCCLIIDVDDELDTPGTLGCQVSPQPGEVFTLVRPQRRFAHSSDVASEISSFALFHVIGEKAIKINNKPIKSQTFRFCLVVTRRFIGSETHYSTLLL